MSFGFDDGAVLLYDDVFHDSFSVVRVGLGWDTATVQAGSASSGFSTGATLPPSWAFNGCTSTGPPVQRYAQRHHCCLPSSFETLAAGAGLILAAAPAVGMLSPSSQGNR